MTLRIILADDHPVVRSGVRALLESEPQTSVVADVGSPAELIDAIHACSCDIVLTDFSMPGGQVADGLHMLGLIRRCRPTLPVIVLTMVSNTGLLNSILATGVRGLLGKSDALTELTLAVQAVSHGRDYLSSTIRQTLDTAQTDASVSAQPMLSKRETEVLRLFASGFTVSEIASRFNRSVKTISRQKMDGMAKLNLKSDLDVYAYAREHGMLT
ncbi:response regulator transcription factor [Dyella sp. EPa41]|uniref:response regulator transcription factor n=1 Tax=Dyella sp. EPa41 TaxID=1561194 RepID=UPI001914F9B5|nr:response regulator transcription factor [Dyella sp. EPa41]